MERRKKLSIIRVVLEPSVASILSCVVRSLLLFLSLLSCLEQASHRWSSRFIVLIVSVVFELVDVYIRYLVTLGAKMLLVTRRTSAKVMRTFTATLKKLGLTKISCLYQEILWSIFYKVGRTADYLSMARPRWR